MLFFVIQISLSLSGIKEYKTVNSLMIMSNFGFNGNSFFNFEIVTDKISNIHMFLIPYSSARVLTERDVRRTCNYPKFISSINQTSDQNAQVYNWSGIISKKDVYYPVFLNCKDQSTSFHVVYNFTNPNYFLDYRNENLSRTLMMYSFLNAGYGTVWLLNSLYYRSFIIPIQMIFAVLPVIRAVKCSFQSIIWEMKKNSDFVPRSYEIFIDSLSTIFFTLFLIGTSLAFSGWCILSMSFDKMEMCEIILSSVLTVVGLYIGINTNNFYIAILAIFLNVIGFLWYIKNSMMYLMALLKICDSNVTNPRTGRRIRLLRNFVIMTGCALSIVVLLHSTVVAVETIEYFQYSLIEFCVIILETVELLFFTLRKEYEGTEPSEEGDPIDPYTINTPNGNFLCLIQREC